MTREYWSADQRLAQKEQEINLAVVQAFMDVLSATEIVGETVKLEQRLVRRIAWREKRHRLKKKQRRLPLGL